MPYIEACLETVNFGLLCGLQNNGGNSAKSTVRL